MAKKKDNYLDYIPRPNTLFECNKNKDGKIEIKMHNKGERLSQYIKILHNNHFIVYENKLRKKES